MENLPSLLNTGDITQIQSSDFVVIKDEEMNEISTFIDTEHQLMLNNFSKSQSNYMDTMLVLSHPTSIQNLRQIGAEIESKKTALVENQYKLRKSHLELKKKEQELQKAKESNTDPIDIELIELEIQHEYITMNSAKTYVEATLKTILSLKNQYETILKNKGLSDITELDFEKEEEEFHIKKSTQQAFEDIIGTSRISKGNNSYLMQIGIMPNLVHDYWIKFLATPDSYDKDKYDTMHHELYLKLKGCSIKQARKRGMDVLYHEKACITER